MKRYIMEFDTEGTQAHMTYNIVEAETGYVLKRDVPHIAAKDMTKRLNSGGGFNGTTPEFFCNRLVVS